MSLAAMDSCVAASCCVIFLTLHVLLTGKDVQSFAGQLWLRLREKLRERTEPADNSKAKKQRSYEGLLELRRTNYVLCARVFVHLGAGHSFVLLASFARTQDTDLIPQILIVAGIYVQHLIVAGKFWQPKPCHIRWMSLSIYLQFVVFVLLTPRFKSVDDALMSCKFTLASRYVLSMVFIDTQLSAVCQFLASVASIFSEVSAGRPFMQAALDDVHIYASVMTISMAVEWLIRSRLEALLDTAEAETMLESFRKMLRAVCDGAVLLDSDLRIQGSHECLKHLLMTSTNLHGNDMLRYVAADEQQPFQNFLEMSSDSNRKSAPDVAPPCLRVSLCGAMNSRVACDIFHVPMPPLVGNGACHLLALREDSEGGTQAASRDAVGEIPKELAHHRMRQPRLPGSCARSLSSASSAGTIVPVEDMMLLVDPVESMELEQVHVSFPRSTQGEGISLRRFMKAERWQELQKTLMDYAASSSRAVKDEPRSEIHRLHLRLFGCKVYAEAQIQRFSTASGQVKIRLHLRKLRQKGSRLLEGIDE